MPDAEPILQACAIPYRSRGELEFCLITSSKGNRWLFPKGIVDPGENHLTTAAKEAWEEAGLHGRVFDEPLGVFHDYKWQRSLAVTVFMMEVDACDQQWPEANIRRRGWFGIEETRRRLDRSELLKMFDRAVARLND